MQPLVKEVTNNPKADIMAIKVTGSNLMILLHLKMHI